MSKKSTRTFKDGGKTYVRQTTRYNNGVSKSVTREQGSLISSGKIVATSRSSGRK